MTLWSGNYTYGDYPTDAWCSLYCLGSNAYILTDDNVNHGQEWGVLSYTDVRTWAMTANSAYTYVNQDAWVYHDGVGWGAARTYAGFNAKGPYGTGALQDDTGWVVLQNFDFTPAAPSSISVTVNSDKTVSVSCGTAATQLPPTYYVQMSINGGAYGATRTMSGQAYTYTAADGVATGSSYSFRVYASNQDGTSGYTTSSSYFVTSGGKRFNGSTWQNATIASRFDGSTWQPLTIARRYNGSSWIDLT